MKLTHKILYSVLIILLLLFYSCAQKKQVKILPVPVDSAMVKFNEAEKYFKKGEFEEALIKYNTFIKDFPENTKTPIAMYNIGFIFFMKKDYEKSRESFLSLVDKYEGSSLVIEAMIKILNSYYLEEKYKEVISFSEKIPDNLEPSTYLIRKYSITGDAYIAEKMYKKAFEAYAKLFNNATGPEKDLFIKTIKDITEFLTVEDLKELKDKSDDKSVKILMYYNYASKAPAKDFEEKDIVLIDKLIKENPENPLTVKIMDLLETIEIEMDCLRNLALQPKPEVKVEKIIYNPKVIGCLLPRGKFEKVATKIEWGVQYALSKITGEPVDISFKYTSANPEKTAQAVRELVKEGVAAIIGPFFSPKAAVVEAQKYGIPIITLNWSPDIVDTGEYVFRNSMTNEMQVKTLVYHAIRKMGLRKFAVLYPENNYGKSYASLFWKEVTKYGAEIRGFESYKPGVTDFEGPIKKIIGMHHKIPEHLIDWRKKEIEKENKEIADDVSKPKEKEKNALAEDSIDDEFGDDKETEEKEEEKEKIEQKAVVDFEAIFIPDSSKIVGLILPQLNFHDVFNVQLLGNNIWHSKNLIKMARRETQKAVLTEGFFSKSKKKKVKIFVKMFKEIFGVEPGFIEALTYDTTLILLDKIKDTSIKSHFELKNALLTVKDFEGITGKTSFDIYGDAQKKVVILKVKGRKFIEVKQ
ncbi:MAG: ABC transporter substrate-binding protein [Desulfobacterales bacterium]|nr:ABC transporter substrate-binding protein [Desulfobacterales bacterium]MCP4160264.1 ABC transporter substrate-binding protein [Deltaproteobacteria bacterium]